MTYHHISIPIFNIKITHVQASILKDDTHSLRLCLETLKFSDNGDQTKPANKSAFIQCKQRQEEKSRAVCSRKSSSSQETVVRGRYEHCADVVKLRRSAR